MLLKVLSRKLSRPDLPQLIRYINQGRPSFQNEPNFIISYNTTGKTTKEVANEFKRNNDHIPKHKGRNGVLHLMASWAKKERHLMNDDILRAFGYKIGELFNADQALMWGRPHYDKENVHLHFALSASWLDSGRSTRISRERLKEIQIELNEMQRDLYPQLKHSLLYLPELEQFHRKTLTGIPLPEKMKEKDGSVRAKMRGEQSVLDHLRERLLGLAKSHPRKLDFIRAINQQDDIAVYHYRNKPNGIIVKSTGKKYRFKRLSIDLDALTRDVKLHQLEQQHNQERSIRAIRER